jgi:hypothetical protein
VRNTYEILFKNVKEGDRQEDLCVRGRIILKLILGYYGVGYGFDSVWYGSRHGPMAGLLIIINVVIIKVRYKSSLCQAWRLLHEPPTFIFSDYAFCSLSVLTGYS